MGAFIFYYRWIYNIVRAKKQLWSAPLCHSLVPHTIVDLLLCYVIVFSVLLSANCVVLLLVPHTIVDLLLCYMIVFSVLLPVD